MGTYLLFLVFLFVAIVFEVSLAMNLVSENASRAVVLITPLSAVPEAVTLILQTTPNTATGRIQYTYSMYNHYT